MQNQCRQDCWLLLSPSTIPQTLIFNYSLDGLTLRRELSIRVLGITLSYNLSPDLHIDAITGRAALALGILIRTSKMGLSVEAMNILIISLVRLILGFGSVLLSPQQVGHIQGLQRIQDRFFRVVGWRLGFENQWFHWVSWRESWA